MKKNTRIAVDIHISPTDIRLLGEVVRKRSRYFMNTGMWFSGGGWARTGKGRGKAY